MSKKAFSIEVYTIENHGNEWAQCELCGNTFRKDWLEIACAFEPTQEMHLGNDLERSEICPDCLKAGSLGAAQRGKKHAEHLRRCATSVIKVAALIEKLPNEVFENAYREVRRRRDWNEGWDAAQAKKDVSSLGIKSFSADNPGENDESDIPF